MIKYKFKHMKVIIGIGLIFSSLMVLNSCEDDNEICTEGTTSLLVLKFYDEATNVVTARTGVISTTQLTDFSYTSQDSIQIPLTTASSASVDTLFLKESPG